MKRTKRANGIMDALSAGPLGAVMIMMSAGLAPETCLALELAAEGRAAAKVVVPDEANPLTDQAADILVR